MQAHLMMLVVAEVLSAVLGITLMAIGIADMIDDSYGLVLGFVGLFNGLALLVCFCVYAFMLRKKMVFPKVLIGFSMGLAVICLQSVFVWAGFQTTLFENYTEKIFELDASLAEKTSGCMDICVDFRSGSFSLIDTLLGDNTQDYGLEKAGAGVSVVALIAQVVIVAAAFLMMRAQEEDASGSTKATVEGLDESSGYAPAPSDGNDRNLLANF